MTSRQAFLLSLALLAPAGAVTAQGHAHVTPQAAARPVARPAAALPAGTVGTVIIAHGGGADWNAQVEQLAAKVRTDGPVEVSFLMGPGAKTARFQDAVARLQARGATSVVVVPVLVSSHSGHYDQVRWLAGEDVVLDSVMHHHLHMSGIERPTAGIPLRVTAAIDASPQVAHVLVERARQLAPDAKDRAIFIVGHGPNSAEDYASWMMNLRQVADSVKSIGGFRDVRVDLVRDDAPAPVRAEAVTRVRELITLQRMATGKDVLVVPVLVSTGLVSKVKLPKDLAGLPMTYTGEALLPHDGMARWVEARVREAKTVTASTP